MLLQTLRSNIGRATFLVGTGLAATLIHAASPWLLAMTVDQLLNGGAITGLTVAFIALGVLGIGLDALHELAMGTTRAVVTGSLRRNLIRHILAVGPSAAQRFGGGDLISRFTGGAAEASNATKGIVSAISSIVPAVAGVVALFLIDPRLGFTFVAGVPALFLLLHMFMRDATDLTSAYQETQGEISSSLVDALSGRQTIAASGTVGEEISRVLRPLAELRRHGRGMWLAEARISWRADALVSTLVYVVLAVAGIRLAAGHLTPGELLAVLQYASMATGLMGLAHSFGMFSRARAGAGRLAEVLATAAPGKGTRDLPPGPGRLEFRAVTTSHWRDVNLVIPGGSSVAIVGASGTGKSRLAALAGRLEDPEHGVISLDGIALSEIDNEVLRREVSYAFDRPILLGDTIASAIAFGSSTAPASSVRHAARDAHADGFIQRLPQGYDSKLAQTPISGGELQRLGLARAFAHAGRLLILDDALSSLDTATQQQISGALDRLRAGRTVLIATHRLTTAAGADLVVFVDDGVIRGPAPHRELWRDPRYRAVFQPVAVA